MKWNWGDLKPGLPGESPDCLPLNHRGLLWKNLNFEFESDFSFAKKNLVPSERPEKKHMCGAYELTLYLSALDVIVDHT